MAKYQNLFAESNFKADSANNTPKNFLDSAPKIAESSQNIKKIKQIVRNDPKLKFIFKG